MIEKRKSEKIDELIIYTARFDLLMMKQDLKKNDLKKI